MASVATFLLIFGPPAQAADFASTEFGGVTTFRSHGTGHAVFHVPTASTVQSITASSFPVALVLSGPTLGPLLYVDSGIPNPSPGAIWTLPPGDYHAYVVTPSLEDVSVTVTLASPGESVEVDLPPWEGRVFALSSLLILEQSPVQIGRGQSNLAENGAVFIQEQYEFLGAAVDYSSHRIQSELLVNDCVSSVEIDLGGIRATRTSFFPVAAGDWDLGVEHLLGGGAIQTSYRSFGLAMKLDAQDPHQSPYPAFWSEIFALPWLSSVPPEADDLVRSGACTLVAAPN
ncbi:MAG TPA: hypothetical protein VGR28_14060 [Candidatus Thermoplasmatota archaeon]|nr:hypothetical protein [Candidatus Thermoplasmatota archaeon]